VDKPEHAAHENNMFDIQRFLELAFIVLFLKIAELSHRDS
jgi:hypothetical protein